MTEPLVMFRREDFHVDFSNKKPVWHILKEEPPEKYGIYRAVCGYERNNILGGVKVSRSKTRKKVSETCGRCVAVISGGKDRVSRPKKRPERIRYVLDDNGNVVKEIY